jgi:hypothetical protein
MANPVYEYLPYEGRDVWILTEYITETMDIPNEGNRVCCWEKYSWGDSDTGPWNEFRWVALGFV